MKKVVALIVVFGIFTILKVSPSFADLSDGLVAYYPFNGNANDESGNDNHGTVYGATLIQDRFGNENSAYNFDGVDDEINILKKSNLDMGLSNFSISAWVKVSPAHLGSNIFGNYAGVPWYNLYITAAKAGILFRPGDAITGGYDDPFVEAISTKNLDDDQWHHLVGIRRGLDTALIYVDGVLEGTATNPAVLAVLGGSVDTGRCLYARIGAVHSNTGHCSSPTANPEEPHFQGLIDEVNIFNRVLSEAEIQELYHRGEEEVTCDLSPVLNELKGIKSKLDALPPERGTDGASTHTPQDVDDVIEDEAINEKIDALSSQIEALKGLVEQISKDVGQIKSKVGTGAVITIKDLNKGVYFMGAKKK